MRIISLLGWGLGGLLSAWTLRSYGHGAYHEVVTELTQVLATSPDDAGLRFKLACAHQEHEEWALALAELERVERLAPGVHETGFVQGQALATGGHWQAAKPVLDEFLAAHPDHAGALAQRARVQVRLQQPLAAVADFQEALKKAADPDDDLYLEAAEVLISMGQTKPALVLIRQGVERLGPVPILVTRLLELAQAQGDYDLALECVDTLQKSAVQAEPWMARRAQILTQAQRLPEAKIAWTALRDRLLNLPNLQRGTPGMNQLLQQAQQALGEATTAPIVAPPAQRE